MKGTKRKVTVKGSKVDGKSRSDAPDTKLRKGKENVVGKSDKAKAPVVTLEVAKKTYDAARTKFTEIKKSISKHKRLIKNGPDMKVKLREQIARAKAGTTQSAENLVKRAKKFEEDALGLQQGALAGHNRAQKVVSEIDDLKTELAEIRAAKSKGRKTRTGKPNPKAARTAFIKALRHRTPDFVCQYTGEVVTGCVHEKSGLKLELGDDGWTASLKGSKKTNHEYKAGAILLVEEMATPPKPKDEVKAKAA